MRLLQVCPNAVKMRNIVGQFRQATKLDEALELFDGSMKIEPGFCESVLLKGQALISHGDARCAVYK